MRQVATGAQRGNELLPLGECVGWLASIPVDVVDRLLRFLTLADAVNMAAASRYLHFAAAEGTEDYHLNELLGDQEMAVVRMHALRDETTAPQSVPRLMKELAIARSNIKTSSIAMRMRRSGMTHTERSRTVNEVAARIACLEIQDLMEAGGASHLSSAARMLAEQGQPVAAARVLQRAIELDPDNANLHVERARACVQAGVDGELLDEAITEARIAIDLGGDAQFVLGRIHIARAHLLRRDADAAAAALNGAPHLPTQAMLEFLRESIRGERTATVSAWLNRAWNTRSIDKNEVWEACAWTGDNAGNLALDLAARREAIDFASSVHSPFVSQESWSGWWGQDFLYRHFQLPEQLRTLRLPLRLPVRDGRDVTRADLETEMAERVERVQAALSLDHPLAVRHVAELLLELGRANEARAWLQDHAHAMEDDADWNLAMAEVLLHVGEPDEAWKRARACARRAVAVTRQTAHQPSASPDEEACVRSKMEVRQVSDMARNEWLAKRAIQILARAMVLRGDAAYAFEEMRETVCPWQWAVCLHDLGRTQEAEQTLEQVILQNRKEDAAGIAEAFARMGKADRFFEWVNTAMSTDYQGLKRLAIPGSPFISDTILQEPRWHAFLDRMNRLPAQLERVRFHTVRPVLSAELFHSHLAGGQWQEAAHMIRTGEFGEAFPERAVMLLIRCLDAAQLDRALQLQLRGEGRPFAERIEFALSMIDEGLLGDRTRRGYVTLLRRLDDSVTGSELLPELTRPERLAKYGMTRQDIASLEIASQFH